MSQPQRATHAGALQRGFFRIIISLCEQADNIKQITYMASRLKPGNRATSRYSTGEVSTAIQLSGGGGASLKKGSWGAQDLRNVLVRAGGGSSIVGGAGGGSPRLEEEGNAG
jgi:hypothetical protein